MQLAQPPRGTVKSENLLLLVLLLLLFLLFRLFLGGTFPYLFPSPRHRLDPSSKDESRRTFRFPFARGEGLGSKRNY